MGFHVGSEVLADGEFNIIDQTLRTHRPELVRALEAMTVELLGQKHNAYYWIQVHTSVEADHFAMALQGVNKALRFYQGEQEIPRVKAWMMEGFARFVELQATFMASLAED
jgi:hypothetical protein